MHSNMFSKLKSVLSYILLIFFCVWFVVNYKSYFFYEYSTAVKGFCIFLFIFSETCFEKK